MGGRGLEEDFADLFALRRLTGIANGIDIEFYDPQKLRHPYTHKNRAEGRETNRAALWHDMQTIVDNMVQAGSLIGKTEVALRDKLRQMNPQDFMHKPLMVAVTRLTGQKIQLFFTSTSGKQVFEHLASMDMHVIFLGKGDLMAKLAEETRNAGNILLFGGFDDELEKRLFASADCMLMPSEFEPCGTSQMKSMRYGCLPVASAVGGLNDTIRHEFNGFLYSGQDRETKAARFLNLVKRALDMVHNDRSNYLKMQRNAMLTDFSWNEAAAAYLKLMQP